MILLTVTSKIKSMFTSNNQVRHKYQQMLANDQALKELKLTTAEKNQLKRLKYQVDIQDQKLKQLNKQVKGHAFSIKRAPDVSDEFSDGWRALDQYNKYCNKLFHKRGQAQPCPPKRI